MCRTCGKLFDKIKSARMAAADPVEFKLLGLPKHYRKPWYNRVVTAEVGIDTYWTVDKMVNFEEWLESNGFIMNPRRTRWIDFTAVVVMLRYKSRKDLQKVRFNSFLGLVYAQTCA